MRMLILFCFLQVLFCTCSDNKVCYSYTLQPENNFLEYELDSDVKMPLLVRTCIGDNDYLYFQNDTWPELLIYDIPSGSLVKRNHFEVEGVNAIQGGFLHGFMMTDCNHIFISGMANGRLYETDTTGYIKSEIRFSENVNGYRPLTCYKDNGKMELVDGKLYLPQSLNWQLGDRVMESPLMCSVDMESRNVEPLPIIFPQQLEKKHLVRGEPTSIAADYKYCFDGHNFVYSFAYLNELIIVDLMTCQISNKWDKSRYISDIGIPFSRNLDFDQVNRMFLESPSYGNILYDNEHKVYYRIVYVPQNIEKDMDMISLIHCGRKQFSIMIYDENFNVIGEDLFPEYTYNPRLCFVYKGSLYISTNHVMRPDYSDDFLSFQKMNLVRL